MLNIIFNFPFIIFTLLKGFLHYELMFSLNQVKLIFYYFLVYLFFLIKNMLINMASSFAFIKVNFN